MTSMVVGYFLLNPEQAVIQTWGGIWGLCPPVPNPLYLPNNSQVLGPSVNTNYDGYMLTEWIMEEPAAPATPETLPSDRYAILSDKLQAALLKIEALEAKVNPL